MLLCLHGNSLRSRALKRESQSNPRTGQPESGCTWTRLALMSAGALLLSAATALLCQRGPLAGKLLVGMLLGGVLIQLPLRKILFSLAAVGSGLGLAPTVSDNSTALAQGLEKLTGPVIGLLTIVTPERTEMLASLSGA